MRWVRLPEGAYINIERVELVHIYHDTEEYVGEVWLTSGGRRGLKYTSDILAITEAIEASLGNPEN